MADSPQPPQQSQQTPQPGQNPAPLSPNFGMTVECLDRFARNFETSARRWELIVYPSVFAFIVLASYGFFLIYHLTSDIAIMARNVSKLTLSIDAVVADMNSISGNMNSMTININDMSKNMHFVANRMDDMVRDMSNISAKINVLEPMQASIQSMDYSTRAMTYNTDHMRQSVMGLNRGINQATGPMQSMSNFVPFW
jgi:hypothetical protein